MATVINNPPSTENSNNPMGMVIGLIVLLVFGYLFAVYGLPAIKNVQFGTPQINVPSKIDVNVTQTK